MKVQQSQNLQIKQRQTNPQNKISQNRSDVSFGGVVDGAGSFLRFLSTNQAWGANFVDLGFMVIPRTLTDFTRGADAGFETGRREASGTVNHSLVGAYGLGAGLLLATAFNKEFGVKAHKLFANDDTIDAFGDIYNEALKANNGDKVKSIKQSISTVLDNLHSFTEDGWKKVEFANAEHKQSIIDKLEESILKEKPDTTGMSFFDKIKANKQYKKEVKETNKFVSNLIGYNAGAEHKVKFIDPSTSKSAESSLGEMIDSTHNLFKTFISPKVHNAFMSAAELAENKFIKGIKKLNPRTALFGLGIASLIGCNIQPLNMYLTRKKTGQTGFVGGGEPDKSTGFKGLKVLGAGAFGAMVYATLGKTESLKHFLSKIQFKGFTPTLNQFKVVYGMTIMSRFLVARNKNELRETATKDTLGFLNWMVLGGFVVNGAAMAFEKMSKFFGLEDKTLIKYHPEEHGKGWFNKLTKADVITRDEILLKELKKAGLEVIKDGKALTYREMVNLAKQHGLTQGLKKIKLVTAAQLLGYLYSGVVLGVGIPKLNIAITSRVEGKQKIKQQQKVYSQSNVAFLSEHNKEEKFTKFS